MTPDIRNRLLVPVAESVTLRETVAYAVSEARSAAAAGESAAVHFVYPESRRAGDPAFDAASEADVELLERVDVWAETDLQDADPPLDDRIEVETALVGRNRYLFSPGDYADVLADYAAANDLGRVVIDPEYNPVGTSPLLDPLETALERTGLAVEEAPVERQARRGALVTPSGLQQYLVIFATSYLFYLLLAWVGGVVDWLTGAVSAGIVALVLGRVSLRQPLHPIRTLRRFVRFVVYLPYLLWEILKANVAIAWVILHPRLPIEPRLVGFRAAVWDDLPVTTLANSITLTPGTLTVDVTDREFYVHSLTAGTRDDLFDGGLERAVRFVFYGRAASRIPSPRERNDVRTQVEVRQSDDPGGTPSTAATDDHSPADAADEGASPDGEGLT
ncbi:monovalent cation/H+ antiporter subunit E [Halobacteriales archaeon Cl-PHB]